MNPFPSLKTLLLALTFYSLFTLPAGAEQTGANPQFGLLGGGQFGNSELESGAAVLGTAGIRFTPYFALDVQGGWMPASSKEKKLADADLTLTSVEFIPRIYVPWGRFQPYVGAGAGRFFIDEQLNTNGAGSAVIQQEVDNQWGGIFTGGFDLAVNENMALGFELSYIYLRSHVQTQLAAAPTLNSSQSINLDTVRALVGLRIKFNPPGWSNVYQ